MASSPPYQSPTAGSPTMPSINPPRKRPSQSLGGSGSAKRRKPSNAPSNLRQTSFPPEIAPANSLSPDLMTPRSGYPQPSRSPSVDSASVHGGGLNPARAGSVMSSRSRRKKGGGDGQSTAAGSTKGGAGSVANGQAEKEDEEVDDDPADDLFGGVTIERLEEQNEGQRRAVLFDALNEDDMTRYNMYRRGKLREATVRKIANQTVSQSLPKSILIAINAMTKGFLGDLITRAREVQTEWHLANPPPPPPPRRPTPPPPPPAPAHTYPYSANPNHPYPYASNAGIVHSPYQHQPPPPQNPNIDPALSGSSTATYSNGPSMNGSAGTKQPSSTQQASETQQDSFGTGSTTEPNTQESKAEADSSTSWKKVKLMDRGPLTPDHLREALRRIKKDREAGSVGFGGLSLEGKDRAAVRNQGRRMFT